MTDLVTNTQASGLSPVVITKNPTSANPEPRVDNYPSRVAGVLDSGGVIEPEMVVAAVKRLEVVVESVAKDSNLVFQINDITDKLVIEVRENDSDKVIRQFPPEEIIKLAEFVEAQDPMTFSEGYLKGLLFDRVI